MERIITAIEKRSSMRSLTILIILSVGIMLLMFYATQVLVYNVYGEFIMPDIRIAYTITELQTIISSVGSEGMIVWAQVHVLDYVFPLTYSLAMAIGLILELRRVYPETKSLKKLILFPFLGCVTDYLENVLILSQILSYPNLSETVVILASVFTTVKWISLALGFVAILGLLMVIVYKRFLLRQE